MSSLLYTSHNRIAAKMSEPRVFVRYFRNPCIIWCTVSEHMWGFTSEIYLKKMPELRTNTFTKPSVKLGKLYVIKHFCKIIHL